MRTRWDVYENKIKKLKEAGATAQIIEKAQKRGEGDGGYSQSQGDGLREKKG